MVMRWKILELAENANSLDGLLKTMKESGDFDIGEAETLLLLKDYTVVLPEKIQSELEQR